jgi:hypothetical protein
VPAWPAYLVGDRERTHVLALQLAEEVLVAHVTRHLDDTDVISMVALDEHLEGREGRVSCVCVCVLCVCVCNVKCNVICNGHAGREGYLVVEVVLVVLVVLLPHRANHLRDVAGDLGLAVAVVHALDLEQK